MNTDEGIGPIVVTGATGFIGRAVVAELRTRGIKTVAVARGKLAAPDGVDVIRMDTYDNLSFPAAAAIIHLAGEARVVEANRAGAAHIEAETELAKAVCESGAGRIVYSSSAQVYGDDGVRPNRPEDSAVNSAPYAEGKKAVENLVCAKGGAVARLSNVYGPGMASTLISDILAQIPGTAPLRLIDADSQRDFLWISDAAIGLVDMALGTATGIFNLASGKTWSAAEVARLILALAGECGRELEVLRKTEKPSIISLDIGQTTDTFGWRPETDLRSGIAQLMQNRVQERSGNAA
ncbi:MAG: NAD(P)-dependent oxidoreductase [Alphaproteobacteria bacterium]|jgi:UDP-glucose 4-epimerase